jgi:hypothetical protein
MRTRYLRRAFGVVVLGLAATFSLHAQGTCTKTWTLDEDFDDGTMINVEGVDNSIRLSEFATPLPYLNVAASNRGTVIRIDINTGAIVGEYLSAPEGMGRNPSRTTVDRYGNVWVANRDEASMSGGEEKGSITRIGVVMGGTRGIKNGDGSFTPDPNGEYLKPPFAYSTVDDRDGDGLIHTSRGLGNILAWTNAGGVNTDGGVSTAEDEAIINYTRVAGSHTRTIAVDRNNDVWCGGTGDMEHEKIDGITGQPIPGTKFGVNCGGYGGLIDRDEVLWSANGGPGLLRYDLSEPLPSGAYPCLPHDHGDYGLGLDPTTGHVWHTSYAGGLVMELAPDGSVLNAYTHGNQNAQGVAVDASGNVWVAHSNVGPSSTVGHLRTDGTYIGNVWLGPGLIGPTGVAIDVNGKVWVTCLYSDNVMRIDPNAGPLGPGGVHVGAVDMVVDLGAGAWPYNYSDMTGYVMLAGSHPAGSWDVVFDGGVDNRGWGTLTWNALVPTGASVIVEVRADDHEAHIPGQTFVPVTSGVSICDAGIVGRYVEVRVRMERNVDQETPVVYDLTLGCCGDLPPVAVCKDVRIAAGTTCEAEVTPEMVNDGSYDPATGNGDDLTLALDPPGPFGLGEHAVELIVTTPSGLTDRCDATVTVYDDTPPVIVLGAPITPWPANHKYIDITTEDLFQSVYDACDGSIDISDVRIISITSDELEDATGNGDGSTTDDMVIGATCRSAKVRAERAGSLDGRVYRIFCEVTDASGNTAYVSFPIGVRHDNGGSDVAIEGPPVYEVQGPCDGGIRPKIATGADASSYALEQNVPNPFGTTTTIPFTLGAAGRVTIDVYDALGARIATALDEERPAGSQNVVFDAAGIPSGTYMVVLESNGVRLVGQMVVLK